MYVRDNVLHIDKSDEVSYFGTMQTLETGSIVLVDGKRYKVTGLNRVELAFGGNRAYLNVKEV